MMQTDKVLNFRDVITLKDGVSVLLRLAGPEDQQAIINLFTPVSDEDVRYLYDDVRDPKLIETWCCDPEHTLALPLIALVKDRMVGHATLHYRRGPERHIGEVRIFLAKDFRQRGLGTRMLNRLIGIARHLGLHLLVAKVVADQSKVIRAFLHLGFNFQYTFEDYFMTPNGDLRDVAFLILKLRQKVDEF
jgi:RimJ/RimL family protein N-acetyltransferase